MKKISDLNFISLKEIADVAKENGISFSDVIIENQISNLGITYDDLYNKMKIRYDVMTESIVKGLTEENKLKIEQENGAKILKSYVDSGKTLLGSLVGNVAARAMAVSEVNASMGKICASPTAGSCGIMPACIYTLAEQYNISEENVIKSLFTASGVGLVVANVASIAGATCGCQAECGVAAAMSSASIVEMLGGTIDQILDSVAITFKNIEGLVCDPVASLVECPCIKRNASCAVQAIVSADMALAGIKSIIPVDEVIESMHEVGLKMDVSLRETALGGLAHTKEGLKYAKKIFGE